LVFGDDIMNRQMEKKTKNQSNDNRFSLKKFYNPRIFLIIVVLFILFLFYLSKTSVKLLTIPRQSELKRIPTSSQFEVSPKDLEKLEKFSGKYVEFEYPSVWSVSVKEDECQNYFSNSSYRGLCSIEIFNQNRELLVLFYPNTGIGGRCFRWYLFPDSDFTNISYPNLFSKSLPYWGEKLEIYYLNLEPNENLDALPGEKIWFNDQKFVDYSEFENYYSEFEIFGKRARRFGSRLFFDKDFDKKYFDADCLAPNMSDFKEAGLFGIVNYEVQKSDMVFSGYFLEITKEGAKKENISALEKMLESMKVVSSPLFL